MKQAKQLYTQFKPAKYELTVKDGRGQLVITGSKTGRPSRRITLHQKNLRVKLAKLTRHDKKSGSQEITLSRINPHKSYDELRLHSDKVLYPGAYEIELVYEIPAGAADSSKPSRELLPCIDEPVAWENAEFKLDRG